jgi:transcriptional regulator GlxA family with amidase domain
MDERIRDVLSLLEREWRRDHRLDELAMIVNLRPSRLEHLFKAAVNRSIREVIHSRRLDEAAKLIAGSYERISEIVYFVGFRDVPNFNHAFRRRFGMSPREYRLEMQRRRIVAATATKLLQDQPDQGE